MSYSPDQVALLAGSIYTGLGAPAAQSVGYVSGWLTDATNLGELNNRLNTCFSISNGAISGDFGGDEAAIYNLMYRTTYFENMGHNALAGMGLGWTQLTEGDSRISRASAVDVSKAYQAMRESSQRSLHIAVANWKRGESLVAAVDAASLYAWPSP